MKSLPSLSKIGIYFSLLVTLLLVSFQSNAQQIDVVYKPFIKDKYLYLSIYVSKTVPTPVAITNGTFFLEVDPTVFDITDVVPDSANPSFDYIDAAGVTFMGAPSVYLDISNSSPVNLGFAPVLLGSVKIPLLRSPYPNSMISSTFTIRDDIAGVDYLNIIPKLLPFPPCAPPNGTVTLNPANMPCTKIPLTVTANVTFGVADSIFFFHNGTLVQKGDGSKNTYTTTNYKAGDGFHAELIFGKCMQPTKRVILGPSIGDATWTGVKIDDYCVASFPSKLKPTYLGGVFKGNGVSFSTVANSWIFDPNASGPGTHKISYMYCGDTVTQKVVVDPAPCVSTPVTGGLTGSTLVSSPQGIYTGCDGTIYYTNTDSNRVYKINPFGEIELLAGPAGLNSPTALVTDPNTGNVYFTDTKNHQIKMIDVNNGNTVTTIAGSTNGFSNNAIGTSAQFSNPLGLAFSSDLQYLYVADLDNYRIRRIKLEPPFYPVETYAGKGFGPNNIDGDRITTAVFKNLGHLSSDTSYLYVSDPVGNRIRKIDLKTGLVSTMIVSFPGYSDGPTGSYNVSGPTGISVDGSGNVYFTDRYNCAIRVTTGASVTTVAGKFPDNMDASPQCGNVDGVGAEARFYEPTALSVFVKGYIDIADTKNNSIRRIAIENWKQSPFVGFDTLYCEGADRDTLIPLYKGGYYVASPVPLSVTKQSNGRWFFDPKVAGPGLHKIGYIYQAAFCTDTFYTTVRIVPTPKPNLGKDTAVCTNNFGTFKLDAGPDFKTYEWYKDGKKVSPDVDPRYLTISSKGTYWVLVTDTNKVACEGRDTINITETTVPIVSLVDTFFCQGGSVLLSPKFPGYTTAAPPPIKSYKWQNGSTSPTLSANAIGQYIVQVTFQTGCVNSDTADVTDRPLPIVTTGKDTSICLGGTAKLSAKPTGAGYTYSWTALSGTGLNSQNGSPSVKSTVNSQYQVTLTDINKCSNTGIQNVFVFDPKATATATPAIICPGGTSNLQVNTTGGAGNNTANYTYAWTSNPASGSISGQNPVVGPLNITTTYSVTVTDSIGCKTTASVPVTIDRPTMLAAAKDTLDMCLNGSVLLGSGTPDNTKYDYSWSPGGYTTLNPIVSPTVGTQYILSITNKTLTPTCTSKDTVYVRVNALPTVTTKDTSICIGGTATLKALPTGTGYSHSWTTLSGTALSSPNASSVIATVNSQYQVTVTDPNKCSNTGIQNVFVFDPKSVATATPAVICPGGSSNLLVTTTGGAGKNTANYGYSWTSTPANPVSLSSTSVQNPVVTPLNNTAYNVIITDSIGCKTTASVSVTIDRPTMRAAAKDTLDMCLNGSVTLGSGTPDNTKYNYSWNPGGYTTLNPTVSPTVGTQYILSITNKTLTPTCTSKDTVYVRVNPLPVVKTGKDTVICLGGTAKLLAQPNGNGYTHSWVSVPPSFSSALYNPTVSPTSSTVYEVTVTDALGCTAKAQQKVAVSDLKVTALASVIATCPGKTSNLSTSTSGGAGNPANYSYTWNPTIALSNYQISNPVASPLTTTSYQVKVIDSVGCTATSNAVTITVDEPAGEASFKDTLSVCLNETVTLGEGTEDLTYTYLWNTGANSLNTNVSPTVFTRYILTITNGVGCEKKDTVYVKVNPLPTAKASASKVVMCKGDTTTLTASPTGLTYAWTSSRPSESSLSNPSGEITKAYPSDTTTYTLTVTDVNGCKDTDAVKVFVNDLQATLDPFPGPICPDSKLTFKVQAKNQTGAVSVFNWSWTPEAGNIYNKRTYTVVIQDDLGCIDTANLDVDVIKVIVNAGPDTAKVCLGDSVKLGTPALSGYKYKWTSPLISSLNNDTIAEPKVSPSVNGYFYLTAKEVVNGCTAKDSVYVKLNTLPNLTVSDDTAICLGSPIKLLAVYDLNNNIKWTPSSNLNFSSIPNPTFTANAAGSYTYTAEVTDLVNNTLCKNRESVTVKVFSPSAAANPATATICASDSTTLGVIFSGGAGSSASWKYKWTPAISLSKDNIANPKASPLANTTYTVVVKDSIGCQANATVAVNLNTSPKVNLGADTVDICLNDSKVIDGTTANITDYTWTPSTGVSDPKSPNPVFNPIISQKYVLSVVSTTGGCNSKDSVFVRVNALPVIDAGKDTAVCKNFSITLKATPNFPTYTWTSKPVTASIAAVNNPAVSPSDTTTYYVEVTNAKGCKNKDSVKVRVYNPQVVASFAGPEICPADTATLNATLTGGYGLPSTWTYSWTGTNVLPPLGQQNPKVIPGITSVYTVTAKDGLGCIAKDTAKVFVKPVFVDAGADPSIICQGDSVQIGPVGAFAVEKFKWTVLGTTATTGLNKPTDQRPWAKPGHTTDYRLVMTDATGCGAVDTVKVSINELFVFITSKDTTICYGSTGVQVKLNTVKSNYTYQWTPNADLTPSDMVAEPLISPTSTRFYKLTAKGDGCTYKDSINIRVNQISPIALVTGSQPFCTWGGDTATILVAIPKNAKYTYNWTPKTGIIDSTSKFDFIKVMPFADTQYSLTVIDTIGCSGTIVAPLSINVVEIPYDAGTDKSICPDESVQLGSGVAASADFGYFWKSASATDLNSTSDPNPTATPLSTSDYILFTSSNLFTDRNGNQCTRTDTVHVVVNDLPKVFAGNDTTVCRDGFVKLAATATPAGASFIYAWNNKAILDDSTSSSPTANPLVDTEFIVKVTDNNNCSNQDTVNVVVNPFEVIASVDDSTVCPNEPIKLTAVAAGADSWLWSSTPGTSLSDARNDTTTSAIAGDTWYYIKATNNSSKCEAKDSVLVKAQGLTVAAGNDLTICYNTTATLNASATGGVGVVTTDYTYNWTPSSDFANPVGAVVTTNALKAPATYYVRAEDNAGCYGFDTVQVALFTRPNVSAGADQTICEGNTALIGSLDVVTYTYRWNQLSGIDPVFVSKDSSFRNVGPTTTSEYEVVVTDANTCENSDTVTVIVKPAPVAAIVVRPSCKDSILLSVLTDPAYDITWTDASNNPLSNDDSLFVKLEGTYNVTITDPSLANCTDSDSRPVVYDVPLTGISINLTGSLCANDSIGLVATTSPTPANIYIWSAGSGRFNDSLQASTKYLPSTADFPSVKFNVLAGNACDTISKDTIVNLHSIPVAAFTVDSIPAIVDQPVSFINTSDKQTYSWSWTFGDGSADITKDPSHTYALEGTYPVQLIATNEFFCKDTARVSLNVIKEIIKTMANVIYVPNVMSDLASDPENRVCKVYGQNVSSDGFDMKIYNRWGEMIYQTSSFKTMNTEGWNGLNKNNDKQHQNGVYTYVLKYKFVDGEPQEKTGTITILR